MDVLQEVGHTLNKFFDGARFTLFVWPKEKANRPDYVSNAGIEETITALEAIVVELKKKGRELTAPNIVPFKPKGANTNEV